VTRFVTVTTFLSAATASATGIPIATAVTTAVTAFLM
jgi:hypothetical protein